MEGKSAYFEMKGGGGTRNEGGTKPLISCTEYHLSKLKGGGVGNISKGGNTALDIIKYIGAHFVPCTQVYELCIMFWRI